MSTAGTAPPPRRVRWRLMLAVAAGIALVLAANAHLVYVALVSQPDCVAHLRTSGAEDGFRAAKSAC